MQERVSVAFLRPRRTGVTTPEGKTTRYEYDEDGNMTKAVREDGETSILYDRQGQITTLANTKDGQIISVYAYAYDSRGNITREETRILKEGNMTETDTLYTYDGKSQLIKAVQTEKGQNPATTTYAYDPAGNRLKMQTEKDGQTLTVTYTYDKEGKLTKTEDSEGGTAAYEYDRAGNLITEKGTEKGNTTGSGTDSTTAANTDTATERHYLYDAAGRLTAVTDKDTLLMAALYDGRDNRTFTMEYIPELQTKPGEGTAGMAEKTDRETTHTGIKNRNTPDGTKDGNTPVPEKTAGTKAFWYGILCQTADILLPAPTPFKAWLHEKMGFTDDITVLWTKETYEADPGTATQTVSETGSPFTLIENIFSDTTQADLAADAYRQVSYVNDINCENTRVLMEYTTDGTMGTSTTAYTYGLQRETYTMTAALNGVGNAIPGMTTENSGTYYYTGTGSVSNLINNTGSTSYTYTPDGIKTAYAMNAPGSTDIQGKATHPQTVNTYENYDYNGEYTHTNMGIQYLRARYYKMATGTFTSKDTYAGTLTDILSQNRYTYAENNPVTYADPSGHAIIKTGLGRMVNSIKSISKSMGRKIQKTSAVIRNNLFNTGKTAPILITNTMSVTLNRNMQKLSNSLQSIFHSERSAISSFVKSMAAISEKIKCSAYASCRNNVQDKIRDVTLAAGAAIIFDDITLNMDLQKITSTISTVEVVGFQESTQKFILQYEGEPFLKARINDNGTYTIAYGLDFSEEEYPEIFNKYLKRDADGNIIPSRTISRQEAVDLIKTAADIKGITAAVNDFINGTGHGNYEKPLEINQNQYDALFSYFYSNGADVFSDENYKIGIEAGGEYERRAKGRKELRDYLITNNGNYNSQEITRLFKNSLGGNIKYDYELRRTEEAKLFNSDL